MMDYRTDCYRLLSITVDYNNASLEQGVKIMAARHLTDI